MKKILAVLCVLIIGIAANAATPEEALTFLNKYINAANTYDESITTFYAPDAKIIREGYNTSW